MFLFVNVTGMRLNCSLNPYSTLDIRNWPSFPSPKLRPPRSRGGPSLSWPSNGRLLTMWSRSTCPQAPSSSSPWSRCTCTSSTSRRPSSSISLLCSSCTLSFRPSLSACHRLVVQTFLRSHLRISKTSYIKMIDVWLLFGLVLPFLGFLLSIFEELVAQLHEDANMGRLKVEHQLIHHSNLKIRLTGLSPRCCLCLLHRSRRGRKDLKELATSSDCWEERFSIDFIFILSSFYARFSPWLPLPLSLSIGLSPVLLISTQAYSLTEPEKFWQSET